MAKVYDPKAVAASIGMKKYGKRRMLRWAAAGRRRASAARAKGKEPKKSMRLGGGGQFAELVEKIRQ